MGLTQVPEIETMVGWLTDWGKKDGVFHDAVAMAKSIQSSQQDEIDLMQGPAGFLTQLGAGARHRPLTIATN